MFWIFFTILLRSFGQVNYVVVPGRLTDDKYMTAPAADVLHLVIELALPD